MLQQAMDLGLPVLARDIPGNAAVVQHEVTGLLYSSPQVLIKSANASNVLCTDVLLCDRDVSHCRFPY